MENCFASKRSEKIGNSTARSRPLLARIRCGFRRSEAEEEEPAILARPWLSARQNFKEISFKLGSYEPV